MISYQPRVRIKETDLKEKKGKTLADRMVLVFIGDEVCPSKYCSKVTLSPPDHHMYCLSSAF